jgi:hypothetical protein
LLYSISLDELISFNLSSFFLFLFENGVLTLLVIGGELVRVEDNDSSGFGIEHWSGVIICPK